MPVFVHIPSSHPDSARRSRGGLTPSNRLSWDSFFWGVFAITFLLVAQACGDETGDVDAAGPRDSSVDGSHDAQTVDGGLTDGGVADGAADGTLVVREVAAGGIFPRRLLTETEATQTFHLDNGRPSSAVLSDWSVGAPCTAADLPSAVSASESVAWTVSLPPRAMEADYLCAISFSFAFDERPAETYAFDLSVQVRAPGAPADPLALRFSDQTAATLQGDCAQGADKPWGATFIDWNNDGALGVAAWYHAGTYPHCAYVRQSDGTMVMDADISAVLRPGGGWGRHSATNWFAFDLYADGDRYTDIIGYGSEVPTGIALNSATAVGEGFGVTSVHSQIGYTDVVLIDWDGEGALETIDDFLQLRSVVTGEILRTLHPVPDDDFVGGRGNPGPVVGDFDGDSWPDAMLFYGEHSVVVRNAEGTAEILPVAPALRSCSARLAFATDFDLDGDLDIACVPEGESTFRMYRNGGAFAFEQVGEIEGFGSIGGITNKSSAAVADLDNDGYEELISFGGYNRVARESCNLVAQIHDGHFVTAGCEIYGAEGWGDWCGSPTGDAADYDNDGDIDLVGTGNQCDRFMTRLMRNDTSDIYRGLNVRVRYRPGNEGCMGCRLEAHEGGERVAMKFMQMTSSFSHNRTNVIGHLGVGDRTHIDLTVVFPAGGGTHVFRDVPTNQTVFVGYAGGSPTLTTGWVPGDGFE